MGQTRVLSQMSVQKRLKRLFTSTMNRAGKFSPEVAARETVQWFNSLEMTKEEREIGLRMVRSIYKQYDRRIKLLMSELETEVFKRFGG